MRTFLTISLLLLSTSTCLLAQIQESLPVHSESEIDAKTYTGIISERYANGSPSLWKTRKDGKAEGLWLEWYPNGTLRYRAYWKNGLGHGKWEYFFPNGQLRSESFFVNDQAQGIQRYYHENGQLKTNVSYLDNAKEGIELTYDENGTLLSRKRFEAGIEVLDEPTIFEKGKISTATGNEWGINFAPDGTTAYFTRRDLTTGKKRIYEIKKTGKTWGTPEIASFSTDEDEAPFISPDGTQLYFASYRPLPDGSSSQEMDMNLWVMNKTATGWSDPTPLSKNINKSMRAGNTWPANYEAGPMVDKEGNLFYWTKGSKNNASNLYFCKKKKNGEFEDPIELVEPSSDINYDSGPQLSPDGNYLFFSSDNRYDGFGNGDIYYSKKVDGEWTSAKNMGPVVNSWRSEGSLSFSPDGKYCYFSSNRGDEVDENGEPLWDIYVMETRFLLLD